VKRVSRNTTTCRRCPTCEGAGEVVVNDTNPFGYGPDPQCDEDVPCPHDGCVRGWIRWRDVDPLVMLQAWRERTREPGASAWAWPQYAKARRVAMAPVSLPTDAWADPLYRQAQADCEAAIAVHRAIAPMFDSIFRRAA
jgi:hypothetical protein